MENPIVVPKRDRTVLTVRILTWVAVALFLFVYIFAPRGITVPWDFYFILFGPVILVDASALLGFILCRCRGRTVSPAYALISLSVAVGVWYVTWCELRLRW
jgi:hypothetical protein